MDKMILYEDDVLIVVHKPAGIATETAKIGQSDMVSRLKNYRRKKGEDTYVGVVHRLDQPVEGLLVFAKNELGAKKLSAGLQNGSLTKKYTALVAGVPKTQEGELSDYLLKDGRTNCSKVVSGNTKGAKEARLHWKLVEAIRGGFSQKDCSLIEIELFTGRHHQIRVQMSHAGFPLLGDVKYGTQASKELSGQYAIDRTALIAHKLTLIHPVTERRMDFSIEDARRLLQNNCSNSEGV